jgi:hypothetical protein
MSMQLRRSAARRPTLRAEGRTPFEEVEPIPNTVAMDAWGGWKGEGIGPGRSLFFASGTRAGDSGDGGESKIYRLDEGSDAWVDEEIPEGAETVSKMRNTESTLYAFFESPSEGQTWIISKSLEHEGAGGWEFEDLPTHGSPVGGRGLAINGAEGETVFAGCSQNWNAGEAQGEVYKKNGGGWELHHELAPSLMWELEFDGAGKEGEGGRLWEFFLDFDREHEAMVFVDGEEAGPPPEKNIADACWFKGHMYVIGNLSFPDVANKIYRSADGHEWEEVHTLEVAQNGDHVHVVLRGDEDGEIWYTGHGPFEAGYSSDGETWTREESVPEIDTGKDTNHRTAIAYYGPDTDDEQDRGVWLFARETSTDTTRVFRDRGAGGVIVQVV